MPLAQYNEPYNRRLYGFEPTDLQSSVLARALAHWMGWYSKLDPGEMTRTAQEIVREILECNSTSAYPMDRDECEQIAAAVGVEA